jgi:hypothetical protein
MSTQYEIDLEDLTAYAIDDYGERHDLNAEGQPCETPEDLRDLIDQLRAVGGLADEDALHFLDYLRRARGAR